jgi:hypothetical protein
MLESRDLSYIENAEYYKSYIKNYEIPCGIEFRYKLTKEKAKQLGTYFIVRRDKKGCVDYWIKIVKGKYHSNCAYTYNEDGSLQCATTYNYGSEFIRRNC